MLGCKTPPRIPVGKGLGWGIFLVGTVFGTGFPISVIICVCLLIHTICESHGWSVGLCMCQTWSCKFLLGLRPTGPSQLHPLITELGCLKLTKCRIGTCHLPVQEANKKIIEQLEQLVEAVEFSAETLEVKMNSHSAKERKMIFTAGLTLKKGVPLGEYPEWTDTLSLCFKMCVYIYIFVFLFL